MNFLTFLSSFISSSFFDTFLSVISFSVDRFSFSRGCSSFSVVSFSSLTEGIFLSDGSFSSLLEGIFLSVNSFSSFEVISFSKMKIIIILLFYLIPLKILISVIF